MLSSLFFSNHTPTTEIYTLSLHDALPISSSSSSSIGTALPMKLKQSGASGNASPGCRRIRRFIRSEEHTSELQSRLHLVCRLLLEKKKEIIKIDYTVSNTVFNSLL